MTDVQPIDETIETPLTEEEIAELDDTLSPDTDDETDAIEVPDDDLEDDLLEELPDDEGEVTEENYQQFFVGDGDDVHEFDLDGDGKLSVSEQLAYDEAHPEPQEGFEEGHGV